MSDQYGTPGGAARHDSPAVTDSELNVKWIVLSGVGTVVIMAVSMVLVWWLVLGFTSLKARQDAPPSALPEAAERSLPPEPRLELSPPENLKEMRDREDLALAQPAWIDEAQGTLRLPIDLALDVVARRGLGEAPPVEPVPEAAATSVPAEPAAASAATSPTGGPN